MLTAGEIKNAAENALEGSRAGWFYLDPQVKLIRKKTGEIVTVYLVNVAGINTTVSTHELGVLSVDEGFELAEQAPKPTMVSFHGCHHVQA